MFKWSWNPNFREMRGRHLTLAKRQLKFKDVSTVQDKNQILITTAFHLCNLKFSVIVHGNRCTWNVIGMTISLCLPLSHVQYKNAQGGLAKEFCWCIYSCLGTRRQIIICSWWSLRLLVSTYHAAIGGVRHPIPTLVGRIMHPVAGFHASIT